MDEHLLNKKLNVSVPFEALYKINVHQDLDESLAFESLKNILNITDEKTRTALLSMLLNGIMIKGAKYDEVVGLLKAVLSLDNIKHENKPRITMENGEQIIGYAGSGKKGFKTINISTPAAILAASCGVYIAKACSHSTSSMSGSSDFLFNIGINMDTSLEEKIELLKKTGLAFFSIEDTTPRFADLYGGRFFAPHALSFALAGLSLPIQVDKILYGLSHPNVRLSVEIFKEFGFDNAMAISTTEDGVHYIDEIGIGGTVHVVGIKDGVIGRSVMCPLSDELNLENNHTMNAIRQGDSLEHNIRIAIDSLKGVSDKPYKDAICANAGLLIYMAGKCKNLREGYEIAKINMHNGKGIEKLIEIVNICGDINKLRKFL